MLYIQAIKCLHKVKNELWKQNKFKDWKTMDELIKAIEKKVLNLELKCEKKLNKKATKRTNAT